MWLLKETRGPPASVPRHCQYRAMPGARCSVLPAHPLSCPSHGYAGATRAHPVSSRLEKSKVCDMPTARGLLPDEFDDNDRLSCGVLHDCVLLSAAQEVLGHRLRWRPLAQDV